MKNLNLNNAAKAVRSRRFLTTTLLLSVLFFIFSCNSSAQKNQLSVQSPKNQINQTDTFNRPKINFKVNRHYDEHGNMIRYDSTYSYVYSDFSSNDSLFNHLNEHFNLNADIFKYQNNKEFFTDSVFKYGLFEDDFFRKQAQLNEGFFDGFYKQLDSIKRGFYVQPQPYRQKKKKV